MHWSSSTPSGSGPHEGMVRNKAVYVPRGVRPDGTKDILGLWIEQTEGAKFWLRVMNELKNRGVEDVLRRRWPERFSRGDHRGVSANPGSGRLNAFAEGPWAQTGLYEEGQVKPERLVRAAYCGTPAFILASMA